MDNLLCARFVLFSNVATTMISTVCTVPSLSTELSLSTVHSVSTDFRLFPVVFSTDQFVYGELI